MTELRTLTASELKNLKASHDYAVALGATCPRDCVFRTATTTLTAAEDFAPPAAEDCYRGALALRAAAERTPEQFERDYKANRQAEFDEEHRRFAAGSEERLTEHLKNLEEAAAYAPAPNGYDLALKALREKENRR
jgi:hypothetical protein